MKAYFEKFQPSERLKEPMASIGVFVVCADTMEDAERIAIDRILAGTCQDFGVDIDAARETVVFCGDSPNDEPMFAAFINSVAVANIREFEARVHLSPKFVTSGTSAAGFVELADHLLAHTASESQSPTTNPA